MTTPNQTRITLKAVKVDAVNSLETTCYTATVYFDGKAIAKASNSGRGGETTFEIKNQTAFDAATAFAATLAPVVEQGYTLDYDLPFLCDTLVYALTLEQDARDTFKRVMKENILFIDGEGALRTLATKRNKMAKEVQEAAIQMIPTKIPGALVLLAMEPEAAYQAYSKATIVK